MFQNRTGSMDDFQFKNENSDQNRDLTRILKIAVQDSYFMKSCSPRQNFAVPVYQHEYLSLIFCPPKKWIFILYCSIVVLHFILYCCTHVLTSKMLNSYCSNNIYGPKCSWAEMVIGPSLKKCLFAVLLPINFRVGR